MNRRPARQKKQKKNIRKQKPAQTELLSSSNKSSLCGHFANESTATATATATAAAAVKESREDRVKIPRGTSATATAAKTKEEKEQLVVAITTTSSTTTTKTVGKAVRLISGNLLLEQQPHQQRRKSSKGKGYNLEFASVQQKVKRLR